MKKRWIGLLALAMGAAIVCGCSKESGSAKEESESLAGASGRGIRAEDYVTLGEYKGLRISVTREEIDDTEIEIQAKEHYFYFVEAEDGVRDRPVELLDMTNIDYEGKKDGVAFDRGTAQGAMLLIGSGSFIDGFEEGLIGVMPGETVDLNLTFPEYYDNPELAGQEVVFTVTVNYIPEMEDDKVGLLGLPDVTTVDGLRAYVKEVLDEQVQSEYLDAAGDEVMAQLLENCVFGELPADMVASNREIYAAWLDQEGSIFGMSGVEYVQAFGMDYESLLDDYAEQYTKGVLIMMAIADEEGLNISDEDLDERMQEYARSAGVSVDDLLVPGLTKEDYRESFLYEDVMNYLVENAGGER